MGIGASVDDVLYRIISDLCFFSDNMFFDWSNRNDS